MPQNIILNMSAFPARHFQCRPSKSACTEAVLVWTGIPPRKKTAEDNMEFCPGLCMDACMYTCTYQHVCMQHTSCRGAPNRSA